MAARARRPDRAQSPLAVAIRVAMCAAKSARSGQRKSGFTGAKPFVAPKVVGRSTMILSAAAGPRAAPGRGRASITTEARGRERMRHRPILPVRSPSAANVTRPPGAWSSESASGEHRSPYCGIVTIADPMSPLPSLSKARAACPGSWGLRRVWSPLSPHGGRPDPESHVPRVIDRRVSAARCVVGLFALLPRALPSHGRSRCPPGSRDGRCRSWRSHSRSSWPFLMSKR